jgi:hypothetical protein
VQRIGFPRASARAFARRARRTFVRALPRDAFPQAYVARADGPQLAMGVSAHAGDDIVSVANRIVPVSDANEGVSGASVQAGRAMASRILRERSCRRLKPITKEPRTIMSTPKKAHAKKANAHAKTTNARAATANGSATSASEPVMRVSQSAIAQTAITDLMSLYEKLALDPNSIPSDKARFVSSAGAPAKLVELIAATADQNAGSVAGIAFDSTAARQGLAYAAAFDPVATAADALAHHVRDAILLAKAPAGHDALAIYTALRGYTRTREGAHLRGNYQRMTQIMKERRNAGQRLVNKKVAEALAAKEQSDAAAAHPAEPAKAATTVVVNPPGGST